MPQTLTFTTPGSVGYTSGGTFTISATSSVGLSPITFAASVDSANVCAVSGNTVSILAPGSCFLTANQAGNAQYSPATANATVTINKASQTVTFAPPSTQSYQQGGSFSVSATATSGLTPVVTSNSTSVCTAGGSNGWTITMLQAGTCSLTATQAGNATYNSATANASITLTTLQPQTVTFAPASPVQYSTNGTFTLSATASSGLNTFTYSLQQGQTSTCVVSGSTVTMTGVGSCYLTASQAGNGTYAAASANATVVIGKGNQTITFAPTSPQTFTANGTFNLTASSSSGLSSFSYSSSTLGVCTVSGSTVTMATAGTCQLTVTEPGNANFNPGTASASVTLQAATGGTANCTSQNLINGVVNLDWGPGFLKVFGMSEGQSYSFALTPNSGDYGKITTIYGGAQKVITISTEQCDFSAALANTRCMATGTDPAISYSTYASRYYCTVTPGQTYYVNIRNAVLSSTGLPYYPIQDSCAGGVCQFSITY